MWIFLNDAALSIVAHREEPGTLLVRARIAGDIEKVFPNAIVKHTPEFDYAYRTCAHRKIVADVLSQRVEAIGYDNFKNSVDPVDHARHNAYLNTWFVMRDYQEEEQGVAFDQLAGAGRISGSIK